MGLLLLEGFELHGEYNFDTYGKLQAYMGAAKVEGGGTSTLNGSTGDYVGTDNTESRINGGRSFAVKRADATGKNATDYVRLHFDFRPRKRVCAGFGWKTSATPADDDTAYPIFQFNYATEFGNEEQLSVWVTPGGGIFCANEVIELDQTTQSGPTPIPDGVGSSKEVIHGDWNYIEVDLNLSTDIPQLHIKVNNRTVIDFVQDEDFQKLGTARISNVALIAPPLNYFANETSLDVYFDDLYISVTDTDNSDLTLGPQQILAVGVANAAQNVLAGTPPSLWVGPGTGVKEGTNPLDGFGYFPASDPDDQIPAVSGICAMIIMEEDVGDPDQAAFANIIMGPCDMDNLSYFANYGSVGGNAGPMCLRRASENAPGNLEMTGAGLAELGVALRISNVFSS